ncbi:MAG: hypothetical protein AB7I33_17440 [Gemmatimonadales bacterium]
MADQDHGLISEGSTAGVIGAVVVAGWFLLLDVVDHQPFFTPSVLGQVILFGRENPQLTPVPEAIALYSFVHFAAFIGLGILVTQLVHLAIRQPVFRFLLLILFVVFEVFFYGFTYIVFTGTRGVFPWWSMLAANTLAAAAMGVYLWRRHPALGDNPGKEPLGAETS